MAEDEERSNDDPAARHDPEQHASSEQHDDSERHGDELPADLDARGYVGPYSFPNNNRRRVQGLLALAAAGVLFTLWLARGRGGVLVNEGLLAVAVALAAAGAYALWAGQDLAVTDTDALAAAAREVGFPIGHASAQLGWRGLRSRPTWRVLLYSAEDPPARRGLVQVDGVDGSVLEGTYLEDNPEDWSELRA